MMSTQSYISSDNKEPRDGDLHIIRVLDSSDSLGC